MPDFLQHLFDKPRDFLPIGKWVNQFIDHLLVNDSQGFDAVGHTIEGFAEGIEHGLQLAPVWLMIALFAGVGYWRVSWRFAVFVTLALLLIAGIGFWPQTMVTLGLTCSATVLSLFIGIPLGICCARYRRVNAVIRPALDLMQTMPAFVYLIPAAMLFGLGRVPGILATLIFAMPPAVRLTSLGIRQVNKEQVEAGLAFGASAWQLLLKVQLPIALPAILTGVNQTIMMALSMVIIASMVGAGGLGNDVLSSIQRLDVGLGFESGLSVVLLAIILDRITESFARAKMGSDPN